MTRRAVRLADPATAPALGASRSRVLAALQDAGGPTGVVEVSRQVGLHPNTTRFHLDALVEAGLAQRVSEQRDVPGRPRTLYSASADSRRVGERSYQLLAQILTSFVASQTRRPGEAARKAGYAWGRFLTERPAPFRRIDAAAATREVVAELDGIGFAPEAARAGRERQILLRHCPFREAAEAHPDVVCNVHLGLMQGMFDTLDAPVEAVRLDPLVEPSLCVTHLAARRGSTPTAG